MHREVLRLIWSTSRICLGAYNVFICVTDVNRMQISPDGFTLKMALKLLVFSNYGTQW